MKKIALAIIVSAALYIVACSLEDSWPKATTDPDSIYHSCTYVLKKHSEKLSLSLYLRCPYDSSCISWVTTDVNWGGRDVENECVPSDYEYTFVSGSVKKKVHMGGDVNGEPLYLDIHADEHVNFSLFDSAGSEKKYDIDLSSIIHSYTIHEDSVDVLLPAKSFMIVRQCPLCKESSEYCYRGPGENCAFYNMTDSVYLKAFPIDWVENYDLIYDFKIKTPYGEDSLHTLSIIYYR